MLPVRFITELILALHNVGNLVLAVVYASMTRYDGKKRKAKKSRDLTYEFPLLINFYMICNLEYLFPFLSLIISLTKSVLLSLLQSQTFRIGEQVKTVTYDENRVDQESRKSRRSRKTDASYVRRRIRA